MSAHNTGPRRQIFVSYSRKDERWRKKLETHLVGLARQFPITYWDDTRIKPGVDWRQELRGALAATTDAILLVSPDFLASEFVLTEELPILLEQAETKGAQILPVIVKPCLFNEVESISRFQSVNSPDRPLSKFPGDQDEVFVRVARMIAAAPDRQASPERTPSATVQEVRKRFNVFLGTTHEALPEEARFALVQQLLQMGMVPAGRQYLPPEAEGHWPAIRRMIEESDYFVAVVPEGEGAVIPAGATPETIEKEYRHAQKVRKPMLNLLFADKGGPEATGPLSDYRTLVQSSGTHRLWTDAESLRTELADGLRSLMKSNPARGWVRAPETDSNRHLALTPESPYRKPIPRLMTEYLENAGSEVDVASIHPLRTSLEFTIRDLEKLCSIRYGLDRQTTIALLDKARGWAYDEKYGNRDPRDDERTRVGIDKWRAELRSILLNLELKDLARLAAVNVGVGNGSEGEPGAELYGRFKKSFIGVDIAPGALRQAQAVYENMEPKEGPAEHLPIESGSVDVYLSLRTYQSTFFDIDRALYEACRVLKPRGAIIISIPNKFLEGEDLKEGLLRPESADLDSHLPYMLDPELPYAYANKIRRSLFRLDFENVGVTTGGVEVYIYGRRAF